MTNLDRVKELTEKLEKNINIAVQNKSEELDSLDSSYLYTLQNIERLKYILSAHKISERHEVVHSHLESIFRTVNKKEIDVLLRKHGIYKTNMLHSLPTIAFIAIIANYIYKLYEYGDNFMYVMGLFLMHYMVFGAIIWATYKVSNSFYMPYKLSDEYKSLPVPKNINW